MDSEVPCRWSSSEAEYGGAGAARSLGFGMTTQLWPMDRLHAQKGGGWAEIQDAEEGLAEEERSKDSVSNGAGTQVSELTWYADRYFQVGRQGSHNQH